LSPLVDHSPPTIILRLSISGAIRWIRPGGGRATPPCPAPVCGRLPDVGRV